MLNLLGRTQYVVAPSEISNQPFNKFILTCLPHQRVLPFLCTLFNREVYDLLDYTAGSKMFAKHKLFIKKYFISSTWTELLQQSKGQMI